MIGIVFILIAGCLDIIANLLLKKSNGFEKKIWGILAIIIVLGAFVSLSFAIKSIPLSIAYASWGALGILGTTIGGFFFFKEKLNIIGWLGILCIIASIVLLHMQD